MNNLQHIVLHKQINDCERAYEKRYTYVPHNKKVDEYPNIRDQLLERFPQGHQMRPIISRAFDYVYIEKLIEAKRVPDVTRYVSSILRTSTPYNHLVTDTESFSGLGKMLGPSIDTIVAFTLEKGQLYTPITLGDKLAEEYASKSVQFSTTHDDGIIFISPDSADKKPAKGLVAIKFVLPGNISQMTYRAKRGSTYVMIAEESPKVCAVTSKVADLKKVAKLEKTLKRIHNISMAKLTITKPEIINYLGNLFEVNTVVREMGLHHSILDD